jgi:hypothetical protein
MEIGRRLRGGKVIRIEVADCVKVTRNSSALVWCGGCQEQDNLRAKMIVWLHQFLLCRLLSPFLVCLWWRIMKEPNREWNRQNTRGA